MMTLDAQLEAILFYKSEPVSAKELAALTGAKADEVKVALKRLEGEYRERGIVLVTDGERYAFGTHPGVSALIEKIQKEEFSSELGRAGLETLAIILYRGPVSRREIDQIRGVNSGFILRTLLIRGLIERTDPSTSSGHGADRSYVYKPTLALFEHLGIARKEDLPEYGEAWRAVEEFVKAEDSKEGERANDTNNAG
jgi:segregation and condensation protein B